MSVLPTPTAAVSTPCATTRQDHILVLAKLDIQAMGKHALVSSPLTLHLNG